MVYGMKRTTIYLPDELKAALGRAAAAEGRSEAEVVRSALAAATTGYAHPPPRLPLFASGDTTLAERDILTLDERHFRVLTADGEPLRLLPADA